MSEPAFRGGTRYEAGSEYLCAGWGGRTGHAGVAQRRGGERLAGISRRRGGAGACSTSLEHGLATTTTYDDAENKRTAMRAATRRILAVAPRKLNHVSTFRFGDIEDLHQLVTTTDAPAELLAQIRDLGAQVITAPAGK